MVISAITAAELEYGVVASGRDAERNRKVQQLFLEIAAHALALGVVLVTNNPADFEASPGLVIENWVA